ncbi:MAG TPA: hypothetical protein VES73_01930 [Lamprocystis sp. (in: g-proteobacteria)]|nr:hypothetical protein [Lamprocystis sp. (in: g-proteobacteria)]
MNAKIAVCLLGIACGGTVGLAAAALPPPADPSYISPAVRALADQLPAAGVRAKGPVEGLDGRIAGLCSKTTDAGDLAAALLLLGYDVYTVVRDTILACGTKGNGPAVASAVATRVLLLRGATARPLIDAGVLGAAAEIERRRREVPTVAARSGGEQQSAAVRDRERERLERMMRKGLIDDVYRDYIEEKRRQAEQTAIPENFDPSNFTPEDAAIYAVLFTEGLVGQGYFDPIIDPGSDAGGTASSQ